MTIASAIAHYRENTREEGAVRTLTKVILAVQVLFVIWIATGVNGESTCTDSAFADACRQGEDIGRGFAVLFIIGIWALVDVILGVIWVVTNKPRGEVPPPKGMLAVNCVRCNARQNIPIGASKFECWQCKTTIPVVVQS